VWKSAQVWLALPCSEPAPVAGSDAALPPPLEEHWKNILRGRIINEFKNLSRPPRGSIQARPTMCVFGVGESWRLPDSELRPPAPPVQPH
jgi:hypothetical protein